MCVHAMPNGFNSLSFFTHIVVNAVNVVNANVNVNVYNKNNSIYIDSICKEKKERKIRKKKNSGNPKKGEIGQGHKVY